MAALEHNTPDLPAKKIRRLPLTVREIFVAFALLWLFISAIDLFLLWFIRNSPLRASRFTLSERGAIASLDLVTSGCSLAICAMLFWIISKYVVNPLAMKYLVIRLSARFILFIFTFIFVFLYIASWGSFFGVGSFLDREILAFSTQQSLQVLHWIPGAVIVGMPFVALILSFLIAWGLPRLARRLGRKGIVISRVALAVFTIATLNLAIGRPSQSRRDEMLADAGATSSITLLVGQQYDFFASKVSGPFGRAKADLRAMLFPPDQLLRLSPNIRIEYRPIIPMQQYVDRVNRGTFKPYNVMVIVVESLTSAALKPWGCPQDVMPNVNALAADSLVYLRGYAEATHSNYATFCPVSSQYPLRYADSLPYLANLPYPRVMLYDILKPLGYRTATFSSHNEFWAGMVHYWDTGNLDKMLHAGNWSGETYVSAADTGFARWVARTKNAGHIDDRYTSDEVIKWIDSGTPPSDPTKPFFIYYNPQNSHFPYTVPTGFHRRFSDGKIDFLMTFNHYPPERAGDVRNLYFDSLLYVDQQLGKIFDHLKTAGLWDKTIIVVTGDHGQAFYQHGFGAHANALYDEGLHIPIIIHAPGLSAGENSTPIEHVDIPPSLLHLLGLPVHPGQQGKDIFDPRVPPERSLFSVVQTPVAHQYAIIRGRYKLIYDESFNAYALYDLIGDPGEMRDLLRNRPDIASFLLEKLETWRAAQLSYYDSALRMRSVYPPMLVDNGEKAPE